MQIVKGVLLGTGLFLVGTIFYLVVIMTEIISKSQNKATGITVLEAFTIWNPLYWLAFAVMIGVGCWIVRKRRQA